MVRPLKIAVLLLSVSPLFNQCLLHLYPTHLTDLPTWLPHAPANDCSNFSHRDSLSKGQLGAGPSAGFPGNWWAKLPSISLISGNLPLPVGVKFARFVASPRAAAYIVGCCSRTLLQTCKISHPLNHWCLCRWLRALWSWSWANTSLVGLWGAAQQPKNRKIINSIQLLLIRCSLVFFKTVRYLQKY